MVNVVKKDSDEVCMCLSESVKSEEQEEKAQNESDRRMPICTGTVKNECKHKVNGWHFG